MNIDKNIILIGDIHGEFRKLNYELHTRRNIDNSLLIQLGDFGVGFHKDNYYWTEFEKLNKKLKTHNNYLMAFRGNHDNPKWFDGSVEFSNMKLVPDYTTINDYNILLIGGESSIDYKLRDEKSWWKDELPPFDINKLNEIKNIEYVLAHSNPFEIYPVVGDEYTLMGKKLLRENFDVLIKNNPIKKWYNGHFHKSSNLLMDGVEFITLDIMELKELTTWKMK